ncbi:DUF308 domain-containing protein [Leucobacter sp. CSA2]|uniref:DUF308 domain-containing protein n=2 Tax=Leucobacter edaphi TaxID=2796472 RepID=A0A934QAY9_9MICO|nr:DUF308 domain-containing protein [Leucobacter edaphi]
MSPFPARRASASASPAGGRSARIGGVIAGVIVALAGVALVIWPFFSASWLLVLIFGTAIIANGIAVLVRRGPGSLVGGTLLILLGVFAMAFTPTTASVLVTLLGGFLVVVAIGWLAVGSRLAGARPLVLIPGILLLVAGIVALIWPSIALSIIAVVTGVVMIAVGVMIVRGAVSVRRTPAAEETIIIVDRPDAGGAGGASPVGSSDR